MNPDRTARAARVACGERPCAFHQMTDTMAFILPERTHRALQASRSLLRPARKFSRQDLNNSEQFSTILNNPQHRRLVRSACLAAMSPTRGGARARSSPPCTNEPIVHGRTQAASTKSLETIVCVNRKIQRRNANKCERTHTNANSAAHGRCSTAGAREKLRRPRFRPNSGGASSATAIAGSLASSTTRSAG